MKRKIFSILFALVLVVSLSLVTAVPAGAYVAPDDVWVDDGWTSQGDVDVFDPALTWDTDAFDTIQEGINAAAEDGTVNVAPGTYYETIDVTVDGLTIQSLSGDPSDTIIDADGADHTVVSILSSNVIFRGFTITGAIGLTYADWSYQGNSGVFMRIVEGCHLSNLIIDDIRRETPGHGNGIFLQGSCDNTFESITISNIAGGAGGGMIMGILFRGDVGGSTGNSFTDITIDTITLENADPNFGATGIMLWGGNNNDNTFDTVEITNLTAPQAACGIRTDCEGNSFKSTEISSLTAPKAYGILLNSAVNETFEGTTISNIAGGPGAARGVYLYGGFGPTYGNSFTSTDISGLTGDTAQGIYAIAGPHDNSFSGGSISGAKYGVYISGSCPNHSIHNTNIVGNTEYGAYSDTVALDAEDNWWDSPSGPTHASNTYTAPGGDPQGDAVSDLVDFVPWLGGLGGEPFAPVTLDDPPGQFSSIQAAIDAAGGTTITCAAGTYAEAVLILGKTLKLLGEPGAIIKPDASTLKYDCFKGVGIDSDRRAGIYIYQVDGVIIDGFEIDGTGTDVHYGIIGKYSDGSTVRNCVVHDIVNAIEAPVSDIAGVGIMFWNEISGEWSGVHDVVIEDNVVYETGRMGIFLGGYDEGDWLLSSNNVIEDNEVHDTWQGPTNGSGGAVTVMGVSGSLIQRNEVYNNTGLDQSGISILGLAPDTNLIVQNGIHDNYIGVEVLGGLVGVHYNNFCGNTVGLDNKGAGTVDATNNWWCHASGPSHSPGYGDPVSGDVLYDPWLLEPLVPGAPLPTQFDKTLVLNIGWTLVSTDNWIDATETVGEGVILALNYIPGQEPGEGWSEATPADLVPVNAIYLKMEEGGGLGINYSGGVPSESSKDLVAGWNLISSATIDNARNILSPLRYIDVGDEQGVGLATLVSQGDYNQHTASFTLATFALEWLTTLGQTELNPFDGYWVYMNAAKSFGVVPGAQP